MKDKNGILIFYLNPHGFINPYSAIMDATSREEREEAKKYFLKYMENYYER